MKALYTFAAKKPPRRWLGGWVWPLKYSAKQGTPGFSLGGAPFFVAVYYVQKHIRKMVKQKEKK